MALVALEIPKVGLVMENARIVRWLKAVGDAVQQGEPLLELETEKSIVEIESTESGRLVEILMPAEEEAHVGDRIAWLENNLPDAPAARSAQSAVIVPAAAGPAITSTPDAAPGANRATKTDRTISSPVARRLAALHMLDLRQITGTGPNGRVQLIDVERAVAMQAAAAIAPAGLEPLSSMRRALARSMTLSNATVPQFTVERAVDWTALNETRANLGADLPAGAGTSVNDFLLQGIARALLLHPALNATFSGDANSPDAGIVRAMGTHIGLVVAVTDGLLVPVFHDVERLELFELARRRRETMKRALKGRLRREELEGATFSVSNLGKRGPDRFNAIINPPQSAILAVGRQRDCVVAVDGRIHVRPMSQLTLTVDHRVADGRLASDFLASLVDILESDAWQLTNRETEE